MRRTSKNPYVMLEPLSPELALVDPDLAARARAALPEPARRPALRMASPPSPARADDSAPAQAESSHPYPLWARVTAALWLLVLGILIGGAAVPHAQDRPRVISPAEDAVAEICEPATTTPTVPGPGSPLRPGP